MAKQKSENEELFLTLGISSDSDGLYQTYVDEIVNGKLRRVSGDNSMGCKSRTVPIPSYP